MSFLTKLIGRFGGGILMPNSKEYDEHEEYRRKVLTELNTRVEALTADLENQSRVKKYRGNLGNSNN